jgi:T5SS/PEP-CTERM-associated repeat protein/autotransporter-associated beta strand protein
MAGHTLTRAAALTAALVVIVSPRAAATNFTWIATSGGSFQTAGSWSPSTGAPPGSADTAIFNANATYTVTFTGSVTNSGAQFSLGSATLSLTSGQSYTVSGLNSFSLGTTNGQVGNLKITGGGLLTLSSPNSSNSGTGAGIGSIGGATGNLTVDGAGTTFIGNICDIGVSGIGTVTVQSGALATIGGGMALGTNATGNGTITVTGAGSSLMVPSVFTVAVAGTGAININNGATASLTQMQICDLNNSTGTVTVGAVGTGTLTLNGSTGVGNFAGTNANLNVNAGSMLTANNTVGAFPGGTITTSGTWNQNAGSLTASGGVLNINSGTVTLAAASQGLTVASNGGTNGAVNIFGAGTLAASAAVTVNVGGTITQLSFWNQNAGAINVQGGTANLNGSTLTVAAASPGVTVVGSGMTAGNLNINAMGTLTSSAPVNINASGIVTENGAWNQNAGAITIQGGTLNLNGGTLTSNGTLTVNPGTVNFSGGTFASGSAVTISAASSVTLSSGAWNQTAGTITVQAGSALNLNGGTLTATAAGTGITVTGASPGGVLNLNGASATLVNLTRSGSGTINFTNGTLTVTGAFNNGNFLQIIDGNTATASPQLTLDQGGTTSGLTDLYTGFTRRCTVLVTNGSTLNGQNMYIGYLAGSTGSVSVVNGGSKIQLNGVATYVGYGGTGSLVDSASYTTNGGSVYVGYTAGSSGSIDVNAGNLSLASGSLNVGFGGIGSLLIRNMGIVTQTGSASIGGGTGAAGTATVSGGGSMWSTQSLYVGNGGTGTLTVQGGAGITTSQVGYVANAGGTGTVNLSSGGAWTAQNGFIIGDSTSGGGTGIVHVNPGGGLTATGSSSVALYPGGTLDIAGGAVTASVVAALGGRITWSSGSLTLNALNLDATTFGTPLALGAAQTLTVNNGLSVPAGQALTLAGGSVTAGSLAGPGVYNLQSGSLTATNSNLVIGSAGPLGSTVTVGSGLSLTAANMNMITVNSDGLLLFTGGNAKGNSGTFNSGEIQFASPASTLSGGTLANSGRIDGTGRISAALNNNANGVITVDAGQRLVFSGSPNTNFLNGTISLTGGTVEFAGSLTNNSGGFISGHGTYRGGSANPSGTGLMNSGAVAFSGGTSDIFGKVQNLSGGQIISGGGGVLTFHDDVVHNGTEIRTVSGSRTVFFGAVSGAGPFTGTGPVEFDGDLRPGNSPASVSFAGDVVLGNSANLHAEIGGSTLGPQYDHLQVAGQVSFAGNLDAQLINGFQPVLGQRFDVVTFGARQGSFNTFSGLNLGNGLVFTPDYDANNFYLAVTPLAQAGQSTWTGTKSGSWNNPGNWAPTGAPVSGITTSLVFASTPNSAMANDIPGTLILNQVTFYSVALAYTLSGGGLDFRMNGSGVLPQIVTTSPNSATITAPLTLTNDLTVSGSGTIALNGAISGAGSLTYSGTSTLMLGGNGSSYTGGTAINSGTVQMTAAGALPAGGAVTLTSGTLDLNGFTQSIGVLTLSSSQATNTTPRPIVQNTGGSAALTLGGDVTYSPGTVSPSAKISADLNLGGATRTVTIQAQSGDPYDLAITGHVTGTGGLTKAGVGSVVLTNTSSYTGTTTVNGGTLYLATTNALPAASPVVLAGSGVVNASPAAGSAEVTAGSYSQSIGSISGPAGTTYTLLAGTLTVGNDNTSPAFTGTLNLPAASLVKVGSGTQTLSGTNSQIATTVNGGTLVVTTDAALGPAASPVTVNAFGTLAYAGTSSTGRTFTLNSGRISVSSGQTLTLNTAAVGGGFLLGPGAFAVTGSAVLSGVTTSPNAVISQTGAGSFLDVTNGGSLTVAAGAASPSSFSTFTNQGSGSITVAAGSQINAADFQTYGTLNLTPGSTAVPTQLTNTGTTPLYFNGGSRTFLSQPANAGQFDAGIDLHGDNAVVAGGLLVNNGYVVDSVGAGTKTVIADFGSLVKGAGFYQNSLQTINGGKFQSGNSPGSSSFGSFTFGPGGVTNYVFSIDNATGTAGPSPDANRQVSGWGLVKAVRRPIGSVTTTGDFAWTADLARLLTVHLDTLVNPTTVGTDVPGPMTDFDPAKPYSWLAAHWAGAYSGPTDPAALNASTVFDTSGFQNPISGQFGWSFGPDGRSLSLTYEPAPVPEPGTLALTALMGLGFAILRRQCSALTYGHRSTAKVDFK